MDSDDPRDQIVRRIVLPSGKTIEVLRLAEQEDFCEQPGTTLEPAPGPMGPVADGEEEPAHADVLSTADPHLCPACDSGLVYPVEWSAAGTERWSVELRCPNCEHTLSALLDLGVAESFDEELERGAETLMSDLARLTEANMREHIERFAAALHADAILPADFV